jgi:Secreted repeat of unknown function
LLIASGSIHLDLYLTGYRTIPTIGPPITRTDGTTQATYDGHPLYTYVGDSAPGQDGGNNLNLNGGLWHIVPVSG